LDAESTLFAAGHQPEMFHPGVWVKNFGIAELARLHGGVAINLLVDSDVVKSTSIRVPGGSLERPASVQVSFDAPSHPIPFEERNIIDPRQFDSFGERVRRELGALVRDPLLDVFWPFATQRTKEQRNIGLCLAQARHLLEESWGLDTLELPQSAICRTRSFLWFAAYVFTRAEAWRSIYNSSLHEYRLLHRVRSHSHPVPELTREGDWVEIPFWIWTGQQPARRRAFVRTAPHGIVLSDRQGFEHQLHYRHQGGLQDAVESLLNLAPDVKLRSRALITTLFARLFLCDLFLHGIGGAKYDALTDVLIRRLFQVEPPRFLVLSATMQLAPGLPDIDETDVRRVDHRLRELRFHPETFARSQPGQDGLQTWVERKRAWIRAAAGSPDLARQRWLEIQAANEALQPWVEHDRQLLLGERRRLIDLAHARNVLGSREFAFCLFPHDSLRALQEQVAGRCTLPD
jgi:hypothetical protein